MIYEPDGITPRVFFEVVNGQVTLTENMNSVQEIPGKYRCLFGLVHC